MAALNAQVAAALALPAQFPERDLIIFLAFCAILATLVLQGTTLGLVIRRLGLNEPGDETVNPAVTPEAIIARSAASMAAMDAVKEQLDDPEQAAAADDLLRDLRVRAKQADQSAQSLALARRHQQFAPEHLLKVLLEERDGLARNLIQSAGGDPRRALRGRLHAARHLPRHR